MGKIRGQKEATGLFLSLDGEDESWQEEADFTAERDEETLRLVCYQEGRKVRGLVLFLEQVNLVSYASWRRMLCELPLFAFLPFFAFPGYKFGSPLENLDFTKTSAGMSYCFIANSYLSINISSNSH